MGQLPLRITNDEFIKAIFGEDAPWCHVTCFGHDPNNIPKDQHLIAWKGDYYSRYRLNQNTNQYFTISTFYCDDQQQARRRKALFRQTHCVVLDDVNEKLSMTEVSKLPRPAWVLETSSGSFQWGYILDTPCTDRARVENLLDGLVANGLAPDGRDPGMKGVTRYVRLPEGINNKSNKLVNGQPWQCGMHTWEPFNRVTLEQLAAPFSVDLNAARREGRVDGAAAVSDHPLINIPEIIQIKEVRSDGRFDIVCPWVHEHTGQDDSGSAVFTNSDGTIGFKCHHGACQTRTGADLLRHIESKQPGFKGSLKNWQIMRDMASHSTVSFMGAAPQTQPASVSFLPESSTPVTPAPIVTPDAIQLLCDSLRRERPSSSEARDLAQQILKHVDDLPKIDQKHWHDITCDLMSWSKSDFKEILSDLRKQWYGDRVTNAEFYDNLVFVKELNQFYDWSSQIFFSVEAFQNSFSHEDSEARKIALQDGRVQKVDRLDYAPKQPRVFTEKGCRYANTWTDASQSYGVQGDYSLWSQHFDTLGWTEHRDHIEKWMAFTLRHPDQKINHMLLFGGTEGCGKDYLLYPLACAMGDNYDVISGDELLSDYHDYILSTKYLHINEAELGDRREALAVSNKLKPMAAAPPERLSVNQKGIKRLKVRNILNATMTTNSMLPLRLNNTSRRFYAVWSELSVRDKEDNMTPEWFAYWRDRWNWMKGEGQYTGHTPGWQQVIWHLINVVDLSDFNPSAAPPMTEFLRDIKEQSKSPMQQTLEAFIKKRHGVFQCDMLTVSDMSEVLRNGAFMPMDIYCDPKYFTPKRISTMMREIGVYRQIRTGNSRLWIIRDDHKYADMSSTQIHHEYERQIKNARNGMLLKVVS